MQVIFNTKSKTQNRYTISSVPGFGKLFFPKGALTTTDKDLIRALLNHPLYERGDYELVTNEQMVADYLDGKQSDTITQEIIDGLSLQGIKELGKVLNTKSEQPALIKAEVLGKPITNRAQEVIDFYGLKESAKEPVKESTVETIEATTSTDMTAVKAAEYIQNTPAEELTGFVTEEETRKTVLNALEEKLNG